VRQGRRDDCFLPSTKEEHRSMWKVLLRYERVKDDVRKGRVSPNKNRERFAPE